MTLRALATRAPARSGWRALTQWQPRSRPCPHLHSCPGRARALVCQWQRRPTESWASHRGACDGSGLGGPGSDLASVFETLSTVLSSNVRVWPGPARESESGDSDCHRDWPGPGRPGRARSPFWGLVTRCESDSVLDTRSQPSPIHDFWRARGTPPEPAAPALV